MDRRSVPAAIHLEQRQRAMTSRLVGRRFLREHPREVRGSPVQVAEPHQHEAVLVIHQRIGAERRAQVERPLVMLDRLLVLVESCVRGREVDVRARVGRIEGNHPLERLDGQLGLAHARQVGPAHSEPGDLIIGILGEIGAIRRHRRIPFAPGVLGERADPQPLPMAEPIEQAERLDEVRLALLSLLTILTQIGGVAERGVRQSQNRGRAQSPAAAGPVGRRRAAAEGCRRRAAGPRAMRSSPAAGPPSAPRRC